MCGDVAGRPLLRHTINISPLPSTSDPLPLMRFAVLQSRRWFHCRLIRLRSRLPASRWVHVNKDSASSTPSHFASRQPPTRYCIGLPSSPVFAHLSSLPTKPKRGSRGQPLYHTYHTMTKEKEKGNSKQQPRRWSSLFLVPPLLVPLSLPLPQLLPSGRLATLYGQTAAPLPLLSG